MYQAPDQNEPGIPGAILEPSTAAETSEMFLAPSHWLRYVLTRDSTVLAKVF